MANKKRVKIGAIENPQLEAVIQDLKQGSTPEKQTKLHQALKDAKLLSPCDFDVDLNQQKDGTIRNVHPSQIKFYLLNTNDGHTFFPVFTHFSKVAKMNFGEGIQPKQVVRKIQDFDKLLQDPNGKAQGVVINPGEDNIVIPKNLIALISGRQIKAAQPKPTNVPLNIKYTEPSVYPTKMVNAIYDRAAQTEAISRVWLKMKVVGNVANFFIVVESDEETEHVLNEIREVAVPQAKDIQVEVVFLTDTLMKQVIKESVALYDRALGI